MPSSYEVELLGAPRPTCLPLTVRRSEEAPGLGVRAMKPDPRLFFFRGMGEADLDLGGQSGSPREPGCRGLDENGGGGGMLPGRGGTFRLMAMRGAGSALGSLKTRVGGGSGGRGRAPGPRMSLPFSPGLGDGSPMPRYKAGELFDLSSRFRYWGRPFGRAGSLRDLRLLIRSVRSASLKLVSVRLSTGKGLVTLGGGLGIEEIEELVLLDDLFCIPGGRELGCSGFPGWGVESGL